MKNLALTLAITLFLAACSSGSTVAPVASAVTSTFNGTYVSAGGSDSGSVTFDLVQADTAVSGNVIITPNGASCLRTTTVGGGSINNGFNLSINADISSTSPQLFQIVTTTTGTDSLGNPTSNVVTVSSSSGTVGTVTNTLANGDTQTVVTTQSGGAALPGTINIELAISNNGNSLSGTYVTSGTACDGFPASGEMSLTRS